MNKKLFALLYDEKGIALPFFIICLPVILVSMVFAFDLTNMLTFRHQLQTISDSVSLAGASATSVNPIMGTGYTVDEYGNRTGDAPEIVNYTPIIDPLGAQQEAQSAFTKNEILMEQMQKSGETLTNWEGHVESDTKFAVTVTGEMKTVMWGKVQKMLGNTGGETITVQVKSKAGIHSVP